MFFTILADVFFAWVLYYYALGGWENAVYLLTHFGALPWALLGMVLFLVFFRSDYRMDLPLFIAGWALGYWGEWWGTTRGLWTYWNGATPPDYLPPLWGIGLLTAYRLSSFLTTNEKTELPKWARWVMGGSFLVLPLAAFALRWSKLAAVDWNGRLDGHFLAGLLAAAVLILPGFDLRRDFPLYLCGMLLGGLYEYLGTSSGEWVYITGEVPPIWIVPLWGMATVAMRKLAELGLRIAKRAWAAGRRGVLG
ncbi:MAG: hypothetical protein AB1894_18195 [Chloroflexota bacterium]